MQLISYAKNFLKMDKTDRLLDAIEHPERYTPTKIEEMLQDSEVKETFDLLDKMKSSLRPLDTPDIDVEWKRFEDEHRVSENHKFHWFTALFSRNAAAGIAIAIASFTAVAAIVGVGVHHFISPSETDPEVEISTATDIVASQPDTIKSDELKVVTSPEIVVFDNETLESIITRIGAYYDYTVTFTDDTPKSIRLYFRWNQALPIEEIVESLNNFEQISLTVNDRTITID